MTFAWQRNRKDPPERNTSIPAQAVELATIPDT